MKRFEHNRLIGLILFTTTAAIADDKFALTFQSSIFGGDDSIYMIHLEDGAMWRLGIAGADNIEGTAMLPDGRILALDGFIDDFWDITQIPGTNLGTTGPRFGVDGGLAYHPTINRLYNLNGAELFDISHTWIYRIDPETGQATLVGEDPDTYADSIAISSDGRVYAADNVFTGRFFSVNLGTGRLTPIGLLGISESDQMALAFDQEDKLWAIVGAESNIYTINTTTGQAIFETSMELESFRWGGLVVLPDRPGDCDGDGDTDFADFATFQQCAGAFTEACTCADINRNGAVDTQDLSIFEDIRTNPTP